MTQQFENVTLKSDKKHDGIIEVVFKFKEKTEIFQFDLPAKSAETFIKIYQTARVKYGENDLDEDGDPDIFVTTQVSDGNTIGCFGVCLDAETLGIEPESLREVLGLTEWDVLEYLLEKLEALNDRR